MTTMKKASPNDEGVVAPPLPSTHTVEDTRASARNAITMLPAMRGDAVRIRADELACLCSVIYPCMDNDDHYLACIKVPELAARGIKPNPRKRVHSLTKILCGPDNPTAEVPTFRSAHRRSQEILELAARGVPAENVVEYVVNMATVTMLQEGWKQRRRNGGAGPEPGTAQGTTASGKPMEVKIDPDLAATIDQPQAEGEGTFSAVHEVAEDGRVTVTIRPAAPEQPGVKRPQVDIPKDHRFVDLLASLVDLRRLGPKARRAMLRVELRRDQGNRRYLRLVGLTIHNPAPDRAGPGSSSGGAPTRPAAVGGGSQGTAQTGTRGPAAVPSAAARPSTTPPRPTAPAAGGGHTHRTSPSKLTSLLKPEVKAPTGMPALRPPGNGGVTRNAPGGPNPGAPFQRKGPPGRNSR